MEWQTTLWQDFTIADAFGKEAILDTYDRVFKEWKDDYIYLTELAIVTNWKCWNHYEKNNIEICKLYSDLYYKTREYALDNLSEEQLNHYYRLTD